MAADATSIAAEVGRDWTNGDYYDLAEASMDAQWAAVVWPIIGDADFTNVVEIAAGHGRNTAKLLEVSQTVTATDINETNVEFLKKRFPHEPKLRVMQNNGADLGMIAGGSATFVYCFDAMVHFDSDVVRSYLKEVRRILKPGGRAFIHYSLFDTNPMGTYRDHPGWRNFMSRALFEHWVAKEGMRLIRSSYVLSVCVLAADPTNADGLSYFELAGDASPGGALGRSEHELSTVYVDGLRLAAAQHEAEAEAARVRLAMLEASTSWRMTGPMRWLVNLLLRR